MAFTHGSKAKVLLNGYDLSSYVREASFASSLDTASVDVMGSTAKQSVTGLLDATVSVSGYIDGATGASDDILSTAFANVAATDGLIYCPQGYATLGLPAFGFDANHTSYEMSTGVGDAASWSAQFQSNVGFERGLLSHVWQNEGAGGNTTSLDYGSVSTTNGGVLYVQYSTAATLIVKLQDSADNSTWADVAGAVTVSASTRGYQRIPFSGTIRRYTRILWTGTGFFAASFVRK